MLQKGKCKFCNNKISSFYLINELIHLLIGLALYFYFGLSLIFLFSYLIFFCFYILFILDFKGNIKASEIVSLRREISGILLSYKNALP